jgi:hypothetical protein
MVVRPETAKEVVEKEIRLQKLKNPKKVPLKTVIITLLNIDDSVLKPRGSPSP